MSMRCVTYVAESSTQPDISPRSVYGLKKRAICAAASTSAGPSWSPTINPVPSNAAAKTSHSIIAVINRPFLRFADPAQRAGFVGSPGGRWKAPAGRAAQRRRHRGFYPFGTVAGAASPVGFWAGQRRALKSATTAVMGNRNDGACMKKAWRRKKHVNRKRGGRKAAARPSTSLDSHIAGRVRV